ncbi:MAG: hypothetical protein CVU12_06330 [Bacteroidetes bacterium HGW-Bacteroidetes-7]|jgi:hypothetical protein|nr:MAG: hypothetical protein CVU12_06330 [Bacteroidetes bacterium HGW-Bacteroidetes-7]
MTIRNIFRSAAAILTSAILSSCIDTDKTIGSGLLPGDHIVKVSVAEFNLPVEMRLSDSLQTLYPSSLIVGNYKDSDFGLVEASSAFQFVPLRDSLTFGQNPVPKSLKMYMAVNDKAYFYANDANVPQNFYVYKLNVDLDSTIAYNNSIKAGDYDPIPLNIGGNVYFGGDSLNMSLSLDYARELLSATMQESDSLELFLKKYKGLYLMTDPLPGALEGGRFNMITPTSIYFLMQYRHVDTQKGIDKDSTIMYYVRESQPSVNSFKHSSASLETSDAVETIYMEGFAGIKPYIDFSKVKTQIMNWAQQNNVDYSKVVVAKAEIRLPYENPADFTRLNYYPSQLFLASRETSDKDHLVLYEPVKDLSVYETNGTINRSLLYYSLDVSSYVQRIIQGKITGSALQTWVTPVMKTSDFYSGVTTFYVQNLLYGKAILNGPAAARKPKLILTYAVMP